MEAEQLTILKFQCSLLSVMIRTGAGDFQRHISMRVIQDAPLYGGPQICWGPLHREVPRFVRSMCWEVPRIFRAPLCRKFPRFQTMSKEKITF